MGANRSGWAYGDRQINTVTGARSAYLTILGSAWNQPVLYPTQAEAEAALDERGLRNAKHMNMVVAHVTEIPHGGVTGRGYAYRITEGQPEGAVAECGHCGERITLLGGHWATDDGTTCCYADTSAPYVPHKPKEN